MMEKQPLNQILYGPPGTGKTYKTIDIALQIVGVETNFLTREQQKEQFDELMKKGQIQLLSFHQSMTYEDFVEGIKPKTHDGKITYEIENGIFKNICEKAESEFQNFEIGFENLLNAIKLSKKKIETKTANGKKMGFNKTSDGFALRFNKDEIVAKDHIASVLQRKEDFYQTEELIAVVKLLKNYSYPKPYVLIIDEINRGNVAQIFGELITLIDVDKRVGAPEALRAWLPYSKKTFGIPDNLYIIGTMNSADRSVETMDAALRRRFFFTEHTPQYAQLKTIEKIDLAKMLQTINRRIEQLLDSEHQIGHTYFLNIENLNDLKKVFQQQIIPLLQEYFFHDFGKIGLILGGGFIETISFDNQTVFADFDYEMPENRTIYRVKKEINITEAIQKLLGND